jgi:hypothetical protein
MVYINRVNTGWIQILSQRSRLVVGSAVVIYLTSYDPSPITRLSRVQRRCC